MKQGSGGRGSLPVLAGALAMAALGGLACGVAAFHEAAELRALRPELEKRVAALPQMKMPEQGVDFAPRSAGLSKLLAIGLRQSPAPLVTLAKVEELLPHRCRVLTVDLDLRTQEDRLGVEGLETEALDDFSTALDRSGIYQGVAMSQQPRPNGRWVAYYRLSR
jgi:hypothetical protein